MAGERGKLARIDWTNFAGINTKSSSEAMSDQQLRIAENADHFSVYAATSKPPGSSRVLSSAYTETAVAQDVSWLGFYKASDLNGQILRHVLAASGTKLHKITSGSFTALTGSGFPITETRTAGLVHSADRFQDLFLIQNQDPDLVGRGDTPVKYDGVQIHRWGVLAPGTVETVREAFSSASGFTVTNGTAANEATTTIDGAAVSITKTSVAATNVDLTETYSAFTIDNFVSGTPKALVRLFIPRSQLVKLAQTDAVQIFIGSDGNLTTAFWRFDFDRGDLLEGWNSLYIDLTDADATTGSPSNTAIDIVRFRINSLTNATIFTSLVWDRFVSFDRGVPTLAEGAAGTVFAFDGGVRTYKVSYLTKYGHESNAGPISNTSTLTAARASIELSNVPVSDDEQVIARRIYRTVADGAIHLFVDQINDNSTTTFSDTIADLGLSSTSAPEAGDLNDDNSPPPKAGIVKVWKRTVFLAGLPDRPETVIYSEDDECESFPTLNEVTLNSKITAIYETYSGLVIDTELGKWQVVGDNPAFKFDPLVRNIGCVGRRAAGETRITGFSVDREGMRLYDLNNPLKISEVIRDKFDTEFNKQNIELIHTLSSKDRNAILMFVPDENGDYKDSNYVYQYAQDVVEQGWWWQLILPTTINPLCTVELEDSDGDFHIYMGGDDGMVYELFDADATNWALVVGTTEAITSRIRTKYVRPGNLQAADPEGNTGRFMPRLMELRVSGDATTWTAVIETANASDQPTASASATLTFTFATNERRLVLPVPMTRAGDYCRITLTNSQASVSSTILGFSIWGHVGPGQAPILTGML